MHITLHGSSVSMRASLIRLIVRSLSVSSCLSFSCFSLLFTSSLPYPTCTLTCTPSSMWTAPRETSAAPSPNEEYCSLAQNHPPTGYEPNVLDDFHYSETSEMIFQEESGDMDTEPSYSCDAELHDELIGEALSSPLFIHERKEPANLRQAYHSHEESLLPAQSFFARTSTVRPVNEPSSDLSQKRKSSRDLENERFRFLLERQKRANSCRSQICDPEARTSSRV